MEPRQVPAAFVNLSVHLTGFSETELLGTGMISEYYDRVVSAIGDKPCGELWAFNETLNQLARAGSGSSALTHEIDSRLLSSDTLGPIARNIIKLWYLGSWPDADAKVGVAFTSAEAYRQGLIWKAMGTHPPGAKQPGFGSWSRVPVGGVAHEIEPAEKSS